VVQLGKVAGHVYGTRSRRRDGGRRG
jgi:hypothetical protein